MTTLVLFLLLLWVPGGPTPAEQEWEVLGPTPADPPEWVVLLLTAEQRSGGGPR